MTLTPAPANAPRFALTQAQLGLWFAQKMEAGNPSFNTGHVLWLQGELDLDAFTQAANQAAQEAQALQLRMEEQDGQPQQYLAPDFAPLLEVVDLAAHPNPQQAARQAMLADMQTPLDPASQPLAKQRLYLLGQQRYAWYQRAHHLSNDGYGMALWEGRVGTLYRQALAAKQASEQASEQASAPEATANQPLAPLLPVLEEDAAYRASEKLAKDAQFWQALFADRPEVAGLAANQTAKAVSDHYCHRISTALSPQWRQTLQDAAQRVQIPWPDVLTALTALYCQQMAGAQETVVGVPFMGRLGSASARAPAMVMNVLPLRVAATPEQKLMDFLQHTTREQMRARRHGRYRSEQLRRDLGLLGGNRRLYGALVNVQPFYKPVAWPGLAAQLEILGTGPIDDITIGFRGDATHALELELEANPKLYDLPVAQAHLQRIEEYVLRALQALLADADAPVQSLTLATAAEARRYVFDVNATEHPVPSTTLVALMEAQMRATPEAVALEFEGQTLTYAQLDARSHALALQLQRAGVEHERLVAVALPRSLELVVALVAVLRAGGAYLPLDLQNPPERLAKIVQLAQPCCALVRTQDAHLLPAALPRLCPSTWASQADASQPLPHPPSPHNLAYVIYTSGSTGEPKGVMIEHQAIVNRLEWMRTHYGFDTSDRILQKTPATFDVSVWEFFLPFLSGCTLVIAPPEAHRDPALLARIIRQQRITTCHFVPSMLAAFVAEPSARGIAMRRIFTSGEELPADLRDQTHATLQAELHNLYGPTEAAVDVSYWSASAQDQSRPIPIGYPVWNTRLYVLDAQLRPLPPGAAGDLYLGGVQLARGYLGRDDLTRAAFLPDPFVPGARIYKTGDLARWRSDGALEYIGRSDHQVKLRGLRIELGEIEAAIQSSGMVGRCGVIVRDDHGGHKKLVAYIQPLPGANYQLQALRNHVLAKVPDYMAPSAYVEMAHWPVTSNGKLDRKALPAPDFAAASEGRPLQTATEQRLAQLYAQLLELTPERIHADSDFFSLGGDSLLAVQLLLRVQEEWQRNPGLGTLFANPTVGALAACIDDEEVSFDSGLAPLIQLASGAPALAPLFVIHPAGGICWGYRHLAHALAALGPEHQRSIYGLQSPALDPAAPLPESIEALAAQYVARIAQVQPQGEVHLLGWSVGGIIAQAMAVELEKQGRQVGLVAMLDAYPADVWRAEPEPTPIQALRALLAIAGYDPEAHPELDSREKIIHFLREGDTALGHLPEAALEGVVRVVTDTNRLIRAHHHQRYSGTLTHVRAGLDHASKPQLQAALWQAHAGTLRCVQVPFLHSQLTGKAASEAIAPLLVFNPER